MHAFAGQETWACSFGLGSAALSIFLFSEKSVHCKNKRSCTSEASRCKLEWDTGVEQAHWQSSKNGLIPHGSSADHLEPAQPFNRPAGDAGAHCLRTALGLQPQRRGLSRPDTSAR